jgi:hypothetical protein
VNGAGPDQDAPASTGVGVEGDQVGHLQPEQRLNPVVQVGDQQPGAGPAGRHRLPVGVDVLDQGGVLEQVDALVVLAFGAPEPFASRRGRTRTGPAGRRTAGHHRPVAVQIQLVTGHLSDPVEQLVPAQAGVTDQLVEVLHEQGLVQHRQALELDRAVAEGAGLVEPAAVVRRVGGSMPNHGLQALLLVLAELGPWPLLAAGLGPGQPQGRGRVGQTPPLDTDGGSGAACAPLASPLEG